MNPSNETVQVDLNSLPSPIAASYRQMLETRDIQIRFRMLIKVFGSTLKFLALIVLCDYLRRRDKVELQSTPLDKFLAEHLERPSLGHWNNFLRDIISTFQELKGDIFVPELIEFYYKFKGPQSKPGKNAKYIDQLIFLRNKYVHPDIYPPDAEAEEVYAEAKCMLDTLLGSLSFLSHYSITECTGTPGDSIPAEELQPQPKDTPLQSPSFQLHDTQKTGRNLYLGSFLFTDKSCSECATKVLLYEAVQGGKIKFVLGNHYHVIAEKEQKGEYQFLLEIIGKLREHLKQETQFEGGRETSAIQTSIIADRLDWLSVLELTKTASKTVYNRFLAENRYKHILYTERETFNQELDAFLQGSRQGFILVADSGLGKTNIFCRVHQKLEAAGIATLLLHGRTYNGPGLGEFILGELNLRGPLFRQLFDGDFQRLLECINRLPEVASGHGKLVILVDAINESSDPERLLTQIHCFIARARYPWLKVVMSIRTFVWETLQEKLLLDPQRFHTVSNDAGNPQSFVTLQPFTEAELALAYGKYRGVFKLNTDFVGLSVQSRKVLRNPLLLRFAAEAYAGQVIPQQIITRGILAKYAEERIQEKDRHFLDYLVEALWQARSDELLCDELNKSSTVKTTPVASLYHPETKDLYEKLSDYLFGDPVYEMSRMPVCVSEGCPQRFKPMDTKTILGLGEENPQCPICGAPLGTLEVDCRSTYYRLRSENLIQEFSRNGSQFVRFTYDRMFEYLMGRFLKQHLLRDLPALGAELLFKITRRIRDRHIFWGAVKNTLVEYLTDGGVPLATWNQIFNHSAPVLSAKAPGGDAMVQETENAILQILKSVLIEYYQFDPNGALKLINECTGAGTATARSMSIILGFCHEIFGGEAALTAQAPELEILRRALRHPDKGVRLKAVRVHAALCSTHKDVGILLIRELKDDLSAALTPGGILKLALPGHRAKLASGVDGMVQLMISSLGLHFNDETLRTPIVAIALELARSRLFTALRPLAVTLLARKLASIYWQKGPLPCNYIEMYISLHSDHRQVVEQIGRHFAISDSAPLPDLDELFKFCQIQNGLISWYLYSLIPVLGHQEKRFDPMMKFLERLFEKGNHISKYIALHSLWIMVEFRDVTSPQAEALFERYVMRFLQETGGELVYRHEFPLDKEIKSYLTEKDSDGNPRVYWAKYENGVLSLVYESSTLLTYAGFLMRRKKVTRFDFVFEVIKRAQADIRPQLWYNIIEELGKLGTVRHPMPALKTLQFIIENHLDGYPQLLDTHGHGITMEEAIRKALLQAKTSNPALVNAFVESLEQKHQQRFRDVLVTAVNKEPDYLDSILGETIYQKSFQHSPGIRQTFGKAIAKSGSARNVEGIFTTYLVEFMTWLRTLK